MRDRLTDSLSGGQKQACVLAAMLALDTAILVLDEPTAALDPAGKQLVGQIVERLKQLGKTLVISDPNLDWFQHLVDHALVLSPQGELQFEGSLPNFLQNTDLLYESGIPIPGLTAVVNALRSRGQSVAGWRSLSEAQNCLAAHLPESQRVSQQLPQQTSPQTSPQTPQQIPQQTSQQISPQTPQQISQQISQPISQRVSAQTSPITSQTVSPASSSTTQDDERQSAAVVEFREVTYTYPGAAVAAIADLNLIASAGQILGIIGQNGSGKSTAIRHLNGLLRPQQGTVRVAGQAVARATVAEMARWVGMAFQNPDLMLFNETVEQEVFFALRQQSSKQQSSEQQSPEQQAQRRTELETLLEKFGLADQRTRSPLALSVGEKQILAILCALTLDPAVLVLDEPTFGMDRWGRDRLGQTLRQLQAQGKTILCVSHDLPLLAEYADEIAVFQSGKLVDRRPTRELFQDTQLFQQLHIPLPASVQLANQFLHQACLTPEEFADRFLNFPAP
ncbi:MAG: ATP-binding cassette domain-containing protein [Oculatellaceae cyanobacterium Prado106]|nr:ATP-binding cassette domain-containing protein [Oculatellaceae cyanobacterium Prado106]